jgi:hypothetical protein
MNQTRGKSGDVLHDTHRSHAGYRQRQISEKTMSEKNTDEEKWNWQRVSFSIFYLLLAIVLFCTFKDKIFYFDVKDNTWNGYRFIWCCSAVFIGFAVVAFELRCTTESPFPKYITNYPIQLLAMATLVFGGLHIFDVTSGYLFYYLSFGICFTLGYLVDSYWSFVKKAIERPK